MKKAILFKIMPQFLDIWKEAIFSKYNSKLLSACWRQEVP